MAEIKVRKNGPLVVSGEDFKLSDDAGNAFGLGGRAAISLCRCGQSQNKPFCDGSHNRQGFESECPARDLPAKS
jgi:CDGSH-type Zn-finger protein